MANKSLSNWFYEYGVSHKNHTNRIIHKVCVPLIALSIVALVFSIPFPMTANSIIETFFLNWAFVIILLTQVFYLPLGLKPALFSLVFFLGLLALSQFFSTLMSFNLFIVLWASVFILSWIGQFVGHKIEGQKPSFLQDLSFLLIGPMWIFSGVIFSNEHI